MSRRATDNSTMKYIKIQKNKTIHIEIHLNAVMPAITNKNDLNRPDEIMILPASKGKQGRWRKFGRYQHSIVMYTIRTGICECLA